VVHSKRLGLLDNPGPVPLSQLTDGQFRPSTNLRRGSAIDPESQGPSDRHVISCIGDSRVEAPKDCIRNCNIAICDIPTIPEPSISGDARHKIQGGRGSENWGFREQRNLVVWNRETQYPDGRVVGPQHDLVEDRWHSIRDREKVRPETFGIRIRDPTNPEILTEVTGGEKVKPHVCIEVLSCRVSEVGKSKFSISRVVISR
jgi:hypothetical protein